MTTGSDDEVSPTLYAEDLIVGSTVSLGAYTVTHDEIVAFASQWDPQPFHIDDGFAAQGFFGEVVASGIHSFAIFQRLAVLGAYRHWWMIAGRTIRDIQLTAPVRPGMTLHADLTITDIQYSRTDRAIVSKIGRLTSNGTTVFTVFTDAWVRRRPLESLENANPAREQQ